MGWKRDGGKAQITAIISQGRLLPLSGRVQVPLHRRKPEIHQPEAGKNSNVLNSNDLNKKIMGLSFRRIAHRSIFVKSLVLNIPKSAIPGPDLI